MDKFERQKYIVKLINGGMSYRKIAEIFGVSKTLVLNIKTIFYKKGGKPPVRKCILCNSKDGLINEDLFTICNICLEKIKK